MPLGDRSKCLFWHHLKKIVPRWGIAEAHRHAIALLKRPGTAFVQFGANGLADDPLQEAAVESGARCLLIEPHPYYCDILRKRYSNSQNVEVIECAAGEVVQKRTLYFVPPDIADQMDGSGPPNKWAHGQGSFDRRQVEYRIRANEFRWQKSSLTDAYISKIDEIAVDCLPASEIILSRYPAGLRCVVVIDTQGAEGLILRGLFSRPGIDALLITYEDDRGFTLRNFLFLWMRGFNCLEIDDNVTFVQQGLQDAVFSGGKVGTS
jgi:hypothetical protein